jgi:hypothetical protein
VLSTTPPRPVRASRSSTPSGREAATSTPCKDTEMPLTGRPRACPGRWIGLVRPRSSGSDLGGREVRSRGKSGGVHAMESIESSGKHFHCIFRIHPATLFCLQKSGLLTCFLIIIQKTFTTAIPP